jgi:hypothetical protein
MKEKLQIQHSGILIETINPQPEVRKNAENARDWEYAEEAAYLYRMAVLFKDRFLDPVLLTDRSRLPDPVISFNNLRNQNTLATYTLARNPQGLLYQITMNSEHFIDSEVEGKTKKLWSFGRWAELETLLHEQVHLWQQNFGECPVKPGRSHHNKEFVAKCESLGLHPMLGVGCHIRVAEGAFALLMKEMGIKPPGDFGQPDGLDFDWFKWLIEGEGKGRKGASTLKKWTCPGCGLNVRMGINGNPKLRHEPCETKSGHEVFLVRADGMTHTIYPIAES